MGYALHERNGSGKENPRLMGRCDMPKSCCAQGFCFSLNLSHHPIFTILRQLAADKMGPPSRALLAVPFVGKDLVGMEVSDYVEEACSL